MKILVIGTNVFPLPPKGYSGLEALVFEWSCLFQQAGHNVTVVCPEGSWLPEGIEIITTKPRNDEEQSYNLYKDRLLAGEWDAVLDSSWLWYSVLAQQESKKQLPVIHIYHSDAQFLGSTPPIEYPCIVSLSEDQGKLISMRWYPRWIYPKCRVVYNGIDLEFYKPSPDIIQRSDRWLWLARYTPEKAPLEAIRLAKKCGVPLDLYGDTTIIADVNYLNQVKAECDGNQIVFHEGVSREETVKLFQTHKAIIHLVAYNEAFGLVPVEAMACGMPVIVNRRGALPELVVNGKTGFVVDYPEEVESIIREDKVSAIRAEDCIEQASKFSIEASTRGYLKLFEEMVKQNIYW